MKTKLFSIITICLMMCTLAACTRQEENPVPTPTATVTPTREPTPFVKEEVTATPEPTVEPTQEPTEIPTPELTEMPTQEVTEVPTAVPTEVPTVEPTPVITEAPTPVITEAPTPVITEVPTPIVTPETTPEPVIVVTPEPVVTEVPTPEVTPVVTEKPMAEIINSDVTGTLNKYVKYGATLSKTRKGVEEGGYTAYAIDETYACTIIWFISPNKEVSELRLSTGKRNGVFDFEPYDEWMSVLREQVESHNAERQLLRKEVGIDGVYWKGDVFTNEIGNEEQEEIHFTYTYKILDDVIERDACIHLYPKYTESRTKWNGDREKAVTYEKNGYTFYVSGNVKILTIWMDFGDDTLVCFEATCPAFYNDEECVPVVLDQIFENLVIER